MKDSSGNGGRVDPLESVWGARESSAIVADFRQAVVATGSASARPDSVLVDRRENIIEALFAGVKRKVGFLSPTEISELQESLADLQTFVPPDDAVIVAAYENAKRNHELSLFPPTDRQRARAVLNRIEAGKAAVANFRYGEPEYLKAGASFMTEATRKWRDPTAANQALQSGTGEDTAVSCTRHLGLPLSSWLQSVRLGYGPFSFGAWFLVYLV
jgi:hypothetical protein